MDKESGVVYLILGQSDQAHWFYIAFCHFNFCNFAREIS